MEIQLKFRITIKITGKTIFPEENCVKDEVSSFYLPVINRKVLIFSVNDYW